MRRAHVLSFLILFVVMILTMFACENSEEQAALLCIAEREKTRIALINARVVEVDYFSAEQSLKAKSTMLEQYRDSLKMTSTHLERARKNDPSVVVMLEGHLEERKANVRQAETRLEEARSQLEIAKIEVDEKRRVIAELEKAEAKACSR